MVSFRPDKLIYYYCMLVGVLIAVSSSSWFMSWMGLELNLLSFIPIIVSESHNSYTKEGAMKYFLIQALGSVLILIGASLSILSKSSEIDKIFICALLFKMGAAPVHFWLPAVMQGLSWNSCALLMTVQKIAPVAMLLYVDMSGNQELIFGASILSGILGGIGGLNQNLLKKILAYSSISHVGWLLSIVCFNSTLWGMYLFLYSLTVVSMVLILNVSQMYHSYHFSILVCGPIPAVSMFLVLFSMGGMPPLLGFMAKLIVIVELVSQSCMIWIFILLMSSLNALYFYTRLFVSTMTLKKPQVGSFVSSKVNLVVGIFTLFSWLMLVVPFYFF